MCVCACVCVCVCVRKGESVRGRVLAFHPAHLHEQAEMLHPQPVAPTQNRVPDGLWSLKLSKLQHMRDVCVCVCVAQGVGGGGVTMPGLLH